MLEIIKLNVSRLPSGKVKHLFRCFCGKAFEAIRGDVNRGHTKSCGCLVRTDDHRNLASTRSTKHGMSNTPTWNSWSAMRKRCLNRNDKDYKRYGSKGITICAEWDSFDIFFRDMGNRPEGKTLDRIDTLGNYGPSNCRWATATEQANNRTTTNILTFIGTTHAVAEWARILEVKEDTLANRVRHGWSTEQVLTTPINGRRVC